MPKICFIYTDTNGLHKTNDYVSIKNLYKFARLIAIHYMVGEYENGKFIELFRKDVILKPKTVNFDINAMKIHKITPDYANAKGVDNNIVMTTFAKDIENIDIIVSFNLSFHLKSILVECFRTAIPIEFNKKTLICMASFGHHYEYPKYADITKVFKIKTTQPQLDQYKDLYFILYDEYKKKLSKQFNIVEKNNNCDFID